MIQQKPGSLSVAVGALLLLLILAAISISQTVNRPMGIEELWQKEYDHGDLEGKTVTVRGDVVFEPLSDFGFNAIYLVDAGTPAEHRTPSYAFWFGLRIEGVSCSPDPAANLVTCDPFDPSRAAAFEFEGTVHLQQVGKKEIMWLSDIDFEHSRQWANGAWQPVELGNFRIPMQKD